jgi:hypothetical protein
VIDPDGGVENYRLAINFSPEPFCVASDGGQGNGRLDESKRLTRREIYVCVFVPGKTVIFRLSVVGQRGSWIWINALRAPALTEAERQKRGSVTPRAS